MKELNSLMNKIIEKYLKYLNDESVSSSTGMGFVVDDPYGFVKKKTNDFVIPNKKNKKKKIFMDEQTSQKKPRILIDFDKVIHDYKNGWNDGKLGKLMELARESIKDLHKTFKDVDVVIFTTRACKLENENNENLIKDLENFLEENNIYYDYITGEKISALIYIDDNGYRFTNWKTDLPKIKEIIKNKMGTK